MHSITELINAWAWLSATALGYSTLKKLQKGHYMVPDYVHVQFIHSVIPAH